VNTFVFNHVRSSFHYLTGHIRLQNTVMNSAPSFVCALKYPTFVGVVACLHVMRPCFSSPYMISLVNYMHGPLWLIHVRIKTYLCLSAFCHAMCLLHSSMCVNPKNERDILGNMKYAEMNNNFRNVSYGSDWEGGTGN
jgi:hypothetical protein